MARKLYKFIKAEYAIQSLKVNRLKLSTIDDLNDPFDLCSVDTTDSRVEAFLELHIRYFSENCAMLCFCRNWDSLLLWSHYGDSHAGICLGFDIPDDSAYEMEVHYQPNVIQVSGPDEINEAFFFRLLRTKHESWSYEQESRMFVSRPDPPDTQGLHFIDFAPRLTLSEVIFGSQCETKHFEPAVELLKDYPDAKAFWAHMHKDSFLLGRLLAPPAVVPSESDEAARHAITKLIPSSIDLSAEVIAGQRAFAKTAYLRNVISARTNSNVPSPFNAAAPHLRARQ